MGERAPNEHLYQAHMALETAEEETKRIEEPEDGEKKCSGCWTDMVVVFLNLQELC